jgi:Ca2+-binding RTX toxin-like protein
MGVGTMAETVSGNAGNDILTFKGQTGQYSATLTNPYSGVTVTINESKNIGTHSYDGGAGTDSIFMTNSGDVLVAFGEDGITIDGVERIIAGAGGDVISIASSTHNYGDIIMDGGIGGDIMWSNNGNDTLSGGGGGDLMDGGGGNDALYGGDDPYGESDDDILYGGFGNDVLYGQKGNDVIYGGNNSGYLLVLKKFYDAQIIPTLQEGVNIADPVVNGDPALGVTNGNLSVNFDATATITFRDGFAGYNNTLGAYAIAADGTIVDARIYWGNVKTAGIDTPHIVDLPTGADGGDFGFFIIANGFNENGAYSGYDITAEGMLSFIYHYGQADERTATVYDAGVDIALVYDNGTMQQVLNGYVYHTTERDGSTMLNTDGFTHAVSGLLSEDNNDVLRIGFEDLPGLGDADFEDVLFDININPYIIDISEPGNDVLIGGGGDDRMYGEGGNDLIIMGDGADQAWGGTGSDIFAFDIFDDAPDIIHDFQAGVGGDVLNITDILTDYDPMDHAIADFVRLTSNGSGTDIEVLKGGSFETLVHLEGVGGIDLAALIDNGNLVTDQSVIL